VHLAWDEGVAGSNPVFPTIGAVAHLGERLICIQEVESSILFSSTNEKIEEPFGSFFLHFNHINSQATLYLIDIFYKIP
jgi:hypothetical protein